ncbi:Uncharacterised protein [Legionella donaldsonii]|uniref:Uncharacterized protein n=1 Tax=Legionella donaldsonii TaxID=45060 RepID=A0A378IYZ2_9GAMM|nr:Uncharacterised protein [Legionella donaldsonii]
MNYFAIGLETSILKMIFMHNLLKIYQGVR